MKKRNSLREYVGAKLRSYSIGDVIAIEIESYLAWLVRWLPGIPGFTLRFLLYKVLFGRLASFCFIQPNVYFVYCRRIRCGTNFAVNSNTYINGVGGVTIGDNVLLGPNVVISSGEHPVSDSEAIVTQEKIELRPIAIGDGVWIGANVVVMPGVIIGEGTVVGAGSVVTRSTEPFSVVAGVPARLLRMRTKPGPQDMRD